MQKPHEVWMYSDGKNGKAAAQIFKSDDLPTEAGWYDHPDKVPGSTGFEAAKQKVETTEAKPVLPKPEPFIRRP